ncbi:MAG: cytochrome c maturation protein CcmE [Coriobacteriia bacterium]|nr:cytochrome c maturation protein CcmE [Coriobacteriia bacterium]
MNKRAKQRLIGVTALIIIAIAGLIFYTSQGSGAGAYKKTVAEVAADETLIGQQVQVSGPVVAGSWTPGAKPLIFEIKDQDSADGTTLRVIWDGPVPSAFGDGTVAIVSGIIEDDQSLNAKSLITQCPSKYASATGALSVSELTGKSAEVTDKFVKLTGYVVSGSIGGAGSAERFSISNDIGSGDVVGVSFSGALPSGMDDGSKVVIGGKLGANGVFVADDVSLDEAAQ